MIETYLKASLVLAAIASLWTLVVALHRVCIGKSSREGGCGEMQGCSNRCGIALLADCEDRKRRVGEERLPENA